MRNLSKLRLQFILIASLAVMAILISFVGVFNSFQYFQNNREIEIVLDILDDNSGKMPGENTLKNKLAYTSLSVSQVQQLTYFSFALDKDKQITMQDLTNMQGFDETDLTDFADRINYNSTIDFITLNDATYAYHIRKQSSGAVFVVVIDATVFIDNRTGFFNMSLWMSLYSLIFFVLVVFVFSGWAIRPYVENTEKQKRFITNAGHELKTPLAIISANTEMQELLEGETEWSKSTRNQVTRLTELINRMVTLAKMEEQPNIVLSDVDFSAIAADAAEDFKASVIKNGNAFSMDIKPNITVKAEEKSLFELVTILVDNASKYCDPGGAVTVRLEQASFGKARLEVSNTYAAGKNVNYSKFFQRFYREDESHNNHISGYGIGLSMAESLVKLFKGKLSVHYKGDTITFRVVL